MDIYDAKCFLGKPYEWKIVNKKKLLVDTSVFGDLVEFYDPLIQTPELYLKFGQLKVTELEILKFVKVYGDLGAIPKLIMPNNQAWEMSFLRKEIKDFRIAINLWIDASEDLTYSTMQENRWNEWAPLILERIRKYVIPTILPDPMRSVWQACGAIPVAWLQLWMAIGKQAPVAQCSECTNIFELAPTRRFKKKFCSDSCKQKSWRKNRK